MQNNCPCPDAGEARPAHGTELYNRLACASCFQYASTAPGPVVDARAPLPRTCPNCKGQGYMRAAGSDDYEPCTKNATGRVIPCPVCAPESPSKAPDPKTVPTTPAPAPAPLTLTETTPTAPPRPMVPVGAGQSVAVVTLTVEVKVGTWGPSCTMDQAVTQAAESARERLEDLFRTSSALRVTRIVTVRVISETARKRS